MKLPQDANGNNMTCANNCRGVNPNAVIIGGTAVLAVAAVSPISSLVPLGLGAATVGGGAVVIGQMMNRGCPARTPCLVGFNFSFLYLLSVFWHPLMTSQMSD